MEIYHHGVDRDIVVLAVDGGLTHRNADELESELTKQVDEGSDKVVIDCTALTFISSIGLGVLLRLHHKLEKRGGDVRLAAVSSRIVDMLRLARLDKLLGIYPDVASALADFDT